MKKNMNNIIIQNSKKMKENDVVCVRSGDKLFEGIIKKICWDFDQHIYLINNEWYCQSEVTLINK
jgi:hypothetical protein